MKLTPATIKTLAPPAGATDKTFFDDTVRGFGVRVRSGGGRKFVVQYDAAGGKTRRMTIGAVGALDLSVARNTAKDILARVRLGADPASEKQENRTRALETFGGSLLARYLDNARARMRPRSFTEAARHLTVYAKPLHHRPVNAIDRRAVAALLATLTVNSGPAAANSARASLSAYFRWLGGEGLVDANPVAFTNKASQHGPRTRLLSPDELREIWRQLGDDQYSVVVKLAAYTALRRTEIGNLMWREIDFAAAEIVLPPERTKADRLHRVFLAAAPFAVLAARQHNGREFVFGRGRAGYSGWSKAKAALDQRIAAARKTAGIAEPMPGWTLHDLRRFASTTLHDKLGVPPWIVENILGHVGHKSGVPGVYNVAAYGRETRRAMEKWAAFIDEIVTGKRPAAKVVRLRK